MHFLWSSKRELETTTDCSAQNRAFAPPTDRCRPVREPFSMFSFLSFCFLLVYSLFYSHSHFLSFLIIEWGVILDWKPIVNHLCSDLPSGPSFLFFTSSTPVCAVLIAAVQLSVNFLKILSVEFWSSFILSKWDRSLLNWASESYLFLEYVICFGHSSAPRNLNLQEPTGELIICFASGLAQRSWDKPQIVLCLSLLTSPAAAKNFLGWFWS